MDHDDRLDRLDQLVYRLKSAQPGGRRSHFMFIELLEELMESVDAITAALTQLTTDVSAALADLKAEVQALQADPAAIQSIVTNIDSLDASVKAADPGAQPAPVEPAELPLYSHDGDVAGTPTSDPSWPVADVTEPDGMPLYNFTGDTAGGAVTGDGTGGVWHVYTGATIPVVSAGA